jgi:hypothetical protein
LEGQSFFGDNFFPTSAIDNLFTGVLIIFSPFLSNKYRKKYPGQKKNFSDSLEKFIDFIDFIDFIVGGFDTCKKNQ